MFSSVPERRAAVRGTPDQRAGLSTRALLASFVVALGIIAGIHLLSQVNSRMLAENQEKVEHTLELLQVVNSVRYLVVEMRAASNGYVIAGEDIYLASYYGAQSQLDPAVSRLRGLAADNPQQQQRCDQVGQLLSTYVQDRGYVISERKLRGAEAGTSALRSTKGRQQVESILRLLSDIDEEEQLLLAERTRKVQSASVRFTLISWTGGSVSVALLLVVFYCLWRENALRAQAESELRSSRALLESILNSMGDGVVAADPEGRFTLFNPAAEQILGRGASAIPPQQWTEQFGVYLPDGVTPYPAEQLPLARALRGASVDCAEMRIRRSGEASAVHWLSVTARPMHDVEGRLTGGVAVFGNVTDRKRAEEEIRNLNHELEARLADLRASNQELEAFTYSVSHDLRAPLRQVHGFSKVIAEQYGSKLDAQGQHYLGRIEQGAAQMGRLIDDLLNLSRLGRQPLRRQPTQIAALVHEVRTELESEINGRTVEWRILSLPPVDCDPGLMKQVFANLLANSVKYTRPRERALIEVGVSGCNGDQAIFVRDNGVGFSMKYAGKLFGVFQRLHRADEFEGTGVGLATVQRIVHKHGGRIWADGEEGKGATFSFTLGKQDGEPQQPATEEAAL